MTHAYLLLRAIRVASDGDAFVHQTGSRAVTCTGVSLGHAPIGVHGSVTARQVGPAVWLSWLEHPQCTKRSQVRFPLEGCTGGNQSMFLFRQVQGEMLDFIDVLHYHAFLSRKPEFPVTVHQIVNHYSDEVISKN
ncbi:hypothetical protein HJG60_009362 [Phyllostomus discolor]|uniref:Uncharacterized protein n=1 Tax=Phyllostomus discolor TaxID=89673 RepID=A0A833YBR6_9CHIR|nr:hypothetical protein HJG60_009362 [Phyllostomus discolor]